jgi:hypothetical protein
MHRALQDRDPSAWLKIVLEEESKPKLSVPIA